MVGEFVNDLDLIPLQPNPMIKLHTQIAISGKARHKKYKVQSVPELEKIH